MTTVVSDSETSREESNPVAVVDYTNGGGRSDPVAVVDYGERSDPVAVVDYTNGGMITKMEQLEAQIWSYFSESEQQGLQICHEAMIRARGLSDEVLFKEDQRKGSLNDKYFIELMKVGKNNRTRTIRKLIKQLDEDCFVSCDYVKARCEFTYEGFILAIQRFRSANTKKDIRTIIDAVEKYNIKAGKYVSEMVDYLQYKNRRLKRENKVLHHRNDKLKIENNSLSDMRIKQVLLRMKIKAFDDSTWKVGYMRFIDCVRKECPRAILSERENFKLCNKPYKNCYVKNEKLFKKYVTMYKCRFFKN